MPKFFDKMLNMVGWGEEDEIEEEQKQEVHQDDHLSSKYKGKVVNIHATTQLKVVVVQPETYEDAQEICDNLKAKKPVVINLEEMDADTARRVLDFLFGSVYALDANIQKVSNGIYLVAPYNVDIMGNFRDELKSKGVFSFIK